MSNSSGDADGAAGTLRINLDDLTTGDIEDMEEYAGTLVMPVLAAAVDKGGSSQAMLGHLPAKILTAFLGVMRRKQDPTWTPDRWRAFNLLDLAAAEDAAAGGDQVDHAAAGGPADPQTAAD